MYSIDLKNAQLLLQYSDVFDGEKPNFIEMIHSMNMHKAISIISELIQVRDAYCGPVNALWIEFRIPFETVLKIDYCDMKPESPEAMINNTMLRKNQHIISLQMLLILLKKLFIYGDYETLKCRNYEITSEDYRDIIILQLLVADEVSEKHEINIDTDHFLYATYHLNYKRNVSGEFLRMYYIMEVLSAHHERLDKNVQREGEKYHYYESFTSKYGVTPTEYSSLLFWELGYYFSDNNALSNSSCWRNLDLIYNGSKEKEKISTIIDVLKSTPEEFKDWSKNTEEEEWNFTSFNTKPFIYDGVSEYISISDITLVNAFFEKLFWLIRDCYPKNDSRAMAFFGRLFERYIQDVTKDVCVNNYTYIDEFEYKEKRDKRKSSDAYIRKGTDLLVIEAKGFSVLVDCMAKNKNIEKKNQKLFVDPVLQADKCLYYSFDSKEEFEGVENIYIVSVTLDNINAVPNYYKNIHQMIADLKRCERVRYYFNFNIEEYEQMLFLIENGVDIFPVLKEYFENNVLEPFTTYLQNKYPNIGMTKLMERIYQEATDKMKSIVFG